MLVMLLYAATGLHAQHPLTRSVSLDVSKQRLDNVLEILSNKGNFYFSYNSNIIKKDSLVSLTVQNREVRQILDMLLPDQYEFRESGNYIIIRKAPVKLTMVNSKAETQDNYFTISGYVLDDETGNWITNASIYEKNMLSSTLTDDKGFFKLKLKNSGKAAYITISKEFYHDTTFAIDPGFNQEITVTIAPVSMGSMTIIGPDDYFAPEQLKIRVKSDSTITEYTYTKLDTVKVEKTAMADFLLSSKQKIQSLNLGKFFTDRPFQISLIPGVSNHGDLSSQVINNFSLNVFGGYNGGVRGMEIGGLFNIDKKSVGYLQAAGLFNIVGESVIGLQASGISNTVLGNANGLQVAGISNYVRKKFSGFQVSGIYNHSGDSVNGLQLAGIGNYAGRRVKGSQISGVMNFSNRVITGLQLSGVINYAKKLKGVQIGLINISDTSEGYSIGLVNVVFKGYHKLAFYTNEVTEANAAFKTGNSKLYSILQGGMNFSDSQQLYTFGYGIGSEWRMGKTFSLNPEVTAQYMYLGSWDHTNILSRLQLHLNIKLGKYVTLFGGPAFNVYYSDQKTHFSNYTNEIPPPGYHIYDFDPNVKGWLGWNAGIAFF